MPPHCAVAFRFDSDARRAQHSIHNKEQKINIYDHKQVTNERIMLIQIEANLLASQFLLIGGKFVKEKDVSTDLSMAILCIWILTECEWDFLFCVNVLFLPDFCFTSSLWICSNICWLLFPNEQFFSWSKLCLIIWWSDPTFNRSWCDQRLRMNLYGNKMCV